MSAPAEMPAGRELDALVAEKVMGWKAAGTSLPFYPRHYTNPELPDHHQETPHFSTDIAAAWLVVEKLASQDIDTIVARLAPDDGAEVTIWRKNPHRRTEAAADTAPLATCRAALAAVAEEADERAARASVDASLAVAGAHVATVVRRRGPLDRDGGEGT